MGEGGGTMQPYSFVMMKRLPDPSIVAIAGMALVLLWVAWQQTHPAPEPVVTFETSTVPCIGEPIAVSYAYKGNPEEPWECQPQCDDHLPRYILYSNGIATQCDTPPACNDRGEDDGVTCMPVLGTPAS